MHKDWLQQVPVKCAPLLPIIRRKGEHSTVEWS